MTTASGAREVPFARESVWRALTARVPYCPVCDVSYVFSDGVGDDAVMGHGTRFVCVPGRLDGGLPPQNAVSGQVVEWVAEERIGTELELASESWRTRIDLADAALGSTHVTVTVTHEPKGRSRLLHAMQRRAMQRMVQRTVDSELAKLPDHVTSTGGDLSGLLPSTRGGAPVAQGIASSSVERDGDGWVIHLRGEVDASAVDRLQLQRRLEESAVSAVDVRQLTYIDSTAFPPLLRWAKRSSGAGSRAVIRGENDYFDQMLAVMGLSSMFLREE